jgi:hypothetical protein
MNAVADLILTDDLCRVITPPPNAIICYSTEIRRVSVIRSQKVGCAHAYTMWDLFFFSFFERFKSTDKCL